jgi:hypothetical protein
LSESLRSLFVVILIVALIIVAYVFFFRPFLSVQPQVRGVINANSTWSVTMQEYELTGPLSAETYRISNDNGKVTMYYAATNRAMTVTKEFSVPLVGPDATFLFEGLRADGIWEVADIPVRPHPQTEFIIEVDQTLGDEGGTRSFSFSDPRYWAMTHAQEFELHLPRTGSLSGTNARTLGVAGRKLQDPRYLKMVESIRGFGPPTVLAAENTIRQELIATLKHPVPPQ